MLSIECNLSTVIPRYDRDFSVQFVKVCVEKTDSLPDLDALGESSTLRYTTASAHRMFHGPAKSRCFCSWAFSGSQSAFGGSMGKSTSADRFTAPNNVGSHSIGGADVGCGEALPLLWSSSQDGVGMLPHFTDGHSTRRTCSSRGGRRSDKSSTKPSSTSHFLGPSLPNATLKPITPLECSENCQVPDVLDDGHTPITDPVVECKAKGLSNKHMVMVCSTLKRFDKLSDQIQDLFRATNCRQTTIPQISPQPLSGRL